MAYEGRSRRRSPLAAVIGLIVVVWLIIGAVAAGQRGYYSGSDKTCADASTIALTIVAGPLNYIGVNPKATCNLPQPSK
jgi:membrane protein YdbS with pleckstrin-like domain